MKNKYYNDAIIGGKDITASYSKNGELFQTNRETNRDKNTNFLE